MTEKLFANKEVSLRISGRSFHNIRLGILVSERNCRPQIRAEINAQSQNSGKWQWNLNYDKGQETSKFRDVVSDSKRNWLFQVFKQSSAFQNTVNDWRKVIIQQNHVSGVLSDIRSWAHCNTDVCLFYSRRVINTVACYSHDVTWSLASVYNQKFLRWCGPSKYNFWFSNPV